MRKNFGNRNRVCIYVGVLKVSELNDQDNITYDESESRIIDIGLTIAMVLSLVIFGQIIQFYVRTKNQKIILEQKLPDIKNAFGKYLRTGFFWVKKVEFMASNIII